MKISSMLSYNIFYPDNSSSKQSSEISASLTSADFYACRRAGPRTRQTPPVNVACQNDLPGGWETGTIRVDQTHTFPVVRIPSGINAGSAIQLLRQCNHENWIIAPSLSNTLLAIRRNHIISFYNLCCDGRGHTVELSVGAIHDTVTEQHRCPPLSELLRRAHK